MDWRAKTATADDEESAEKAERNRKRRKIASKVAEKGYAYTFALLPLIGFCIFSIAPIVLSIKTMFCDVKLYNPDAPMIWNDYGGFRMLFDKSYSSLATVHVTELFEKSLLITFWIASTQIVTLIISFIMSVLLAQKLRGSKVFQVLFFIPYICSGVAVALMWRWIFAKDGGIINSIFGIEKDWLGDGNSLTWCIIIAIIWQAPSYGTVMYHAALGNINQSLYEAASLDGANGVQKVIHITIPAVAPTTFYLLMAGISAGLLTYDIAALIVPDGWGSAVGGEDNMGLTLIRLVYYLMSPTIANDPKFGGEYMSAAAIISWILFIITATLSIIVYKVRNRSLANG